MFVVSFICFSVLISLNDAQLLTQPQVHAVRFKKMVPDPDKWREFHRKRIADRIDRAGDEIRNMEGKETTNLTKPLFMFLHIPKTAGSSFKSFLQSIAARLCKMNGWGISKSEFETAIKQSNAGSCDIILIEAGPWLVNEARRLSHRPVEYIIFLRDPVPRTISQLEMFRRFLPPVKRDIPLEELLYLTQVAYEGTGKFHVFSKIDNFQTTFLSCESGSFHTSEDNIQSLFKIKGGTSNFLHYRFDPSCVASITRALIFLENAFFVGFVEDTEQCFCQLFQTYNSQFDHRTMRQMCKETEQIKKVSWWSGKTQGLPNYTPKDIQYLYDVNKLDQILYWKLVEQRGGEPTCDFVPHSSKTKRKERK